MLKPFQKFIALTMVAISLAACTANPATGKQSFTGFMSPEKEILVGKKEHPKILKQFGGAFPDKALATYVRKLGLDLAKVSERPNLPWTFTILNDTLVNAFALPGGYIYVTRGLLALTSDKAELAGVLSHEIGHVTARHTAQRYSSSVVANIGVQVLGVLSHAAGLGSLGGDIASIGANAALKGYSRGQELESDKLGVRYMSRVGYDPQAMVSFFEKLRAHQKLAVKILGKNEKTADQASIFSTHPRTLDRITQAIDLVKTNSSTQKRRDRNAYLSHIDGLLFGDDANEGVIKGRVFIHPVMKFRFEVPEGFTLKNMPNMVLATDKAGANIKFALANAKDVQNAGSMEKYLVDKWSSNYTLSNVEWLDINGMKAVTGEAKVWQGLSTTIIRRVLIERDKDTYWRFQFEIPPQEKKRLDEPLRRTTYSLRPPTKAEMDDAKSLYIRVVKIGPGVTYDDLVAAMDVDKWQADWFQILNNLNPKTPLPTGLRVKVIKAGAPLRH